MAPTAQSSANSPPGSRSAIDAGHPRGRQTLCHGDATQDRLIVTGPSDDDGRPRDAAQAFDGLLVAVLPDQAARQALRRKPPSAIVPRPERGHAGRAERRLGLAETAAVGVREPHEHTGSDGPGDEAREFEVLVGARKRSQGLVRLPSNQEKAPECQLRIAGAGVLVPACAPARQFAEAPVGAGVPAAGCRLQDRVRPARPSRAPSRAGVHGAITASAAYGADSSRTRPAGLRPIGGRRPRPWRRAQREEHVRSIVGQAERQEQHAAVRLESLVCDAQHEDVAADDGPSPRPAPGAGARMSILAETGT